MSAAVLAPADAGQWRTWLAAHASSESEVWVDVPRRNPSPDGFGYEAAIEQALCFGWIDSHARTSDGGRSLLRFTPRRTTSSWSRTNRDRADRLIAAGQMAPSGQRAIDHAKATGRWQVPGEDGGPLPADLAERFAEDESARRTFEGFPPSSRRLVLVWIASARRPETRQRRVDQAVALAAIGVPANHPVHRPRRSQEGSQAERSEQHGASR